VSSLQFLIEDFRCSYFFEVLVWHWGIFGDKGCYPSSTNTNTTEINDPTFHWVHVL